MRDTLELSLGPTEAHLVLAGLTELEAKWAALSETPEGAAEYGNDLVALRMMLQGVRRKAVELFGLGITNRGGEPLR